MIELLPPAIAAKAIVARLPAPEAGAMGDDARVIEAVPAELSKPGGLKANGSNVPVGAKD